ncbi:hypothetical protein Q8F55_003376 [Vanrija albida]|uniref:Uncharacterized protein n=1 Tax=Vanrija albida TaxID=181172 RepID=A0ABR3Q400_9TREE
MPKKYSKKPKSAPPKGSNAPKQPESLPLPTTELPKAAPHSPSTFTTPGPLPTRPSTSSSAPGPSSSALLSYVEITPPPGDNIVLVEALFSALPPTILTFFKMSTSELEGKISKPPALPAAQDATIGSLYPLAPIEFRNCTMTDNLVIPPGMTLELMVAGYAVKGSAGLDKAIAQYPRNTKLHDADPIATGLSVMHREASRGLQRVNEGEGPSTLTHEQVKARAVTIAGVSGYQAYMQHASSKGIDGSGLLPFMEFLGKYVAAVAAGDVPFHNPS